MPAYHLGQKVLISTTGDTSGWCPGWVFGGDLDAIDVVYMTPKGRFEPREACRHADDPRARDIYYIQNMAEDGEGGLWKHAEDTLEVVALREELEELREIVATLTDGKIASISKAVEKRQNRAKARSQPQYTDAPSPISSDGFESDDAEPAEPDMNLR